MVFGGTSVPNLEFQPAHTVPVIARMTATTNIFFNMFTSFLT
jgi:hypothetical protein